MPNQDDLTAGVVTTQQLSTSALAQLHRLAQTAGPEVEHALAQLVAAAQQQAHLHAQHGQVQNNLADLQAMLNRMLQPLGLHIKNWQDPAQALLQLRVFADDFEVQYRAMLLRERTLNQHAIVSATDVHGTITYVNDLFCEINGMAPHQLLGKNHRIIASGIHPRAFYTGMWETISQGHTWHGEICNRSPVTGQAYWVAATIVPFLDANGLPKEYISVRTDITKRKKLEQELAHERSFLESITANLGKGVMVLDREERCTFLNPEAERLLGWTLAQLKGQSLHGQMYFCAGQAEGEDAPACPVCLCYALQECVSFDMQDDLVLVHKERGSFPAAMTVSPLFEDGVLRGCVAVFHDITQHKRHEAELRQAKEQGLQTQFMGAEGAFNQSLVEIAGPALEGMLFTYPADFSARAENQAIVQAFEKAQRPPNGAYQMPAYAAVQVLHESMKAVGTDPKKVAEYMHSNRFDTVIGPVAFDRKGDLKNFDFVVFKLDKSGQRKLVR